MRLYLVRHAQPDIAPGICYGRTDLVVAPQEHARALSALLPALPRNAPIFSSPLRRCRELAVQIATSFGSCKVIHDERLAEMHFGDWEMRAWDDIPQAEVDAWANDLIAYRPGGGESVLQMAQRIWNFFEALRQQDLDSAIVVCHAGTIRLLSQCRRGGTLAEIALQAAQARHRIAYGELTILDC